MTTPNIKNNFHNSGRKKKFLVITAHPDDLAFCYGATVAKLSSHGHQIASVVCTRGDKGSYGDLAPKELAKIRESEEREASKILGITDVKFLNYKDGEIPDNLKLRIDIVRQIRQVKPDVIMTFDPSSQMRFWIGYHPDHRAISYATLDAFTFAKLPNYFPDKLIDCQQTHTVPKAWLFGNFIYQKNDGPLGTANIKIRVNDFYQKKIKAIKIYQSQLTKTKNREKKYLNLLEENMKAKDGNYYEYFNVAERF